MSEKEVLRLAESLTSSSSIEELEWGVVELSCALVQARYDVGEAILYQLWRRVTRLLIKRRRDLEITLFPVRK